jgi:NAD(P)-dependent dehydrogenase (short-subunit alcohol dehydrogenase family)
MTLRGTRILLGGACTQAGSSLVEAFLALGAHVVAADSLRTRLEELRARMRQHERLWVAECDLDSAQSARALFADVARDEPIDAALLVLSAGADGPEPALQRCRSFLEAALATMSKQAGGRVLVLIEADSAELAAAGEVLLQDCDAQSSELPVGGLVAEGGWLSKAVALADPAQPPLRGLQPWGAPG